MLNDISVFVSSCDKNEDLWNLFFDNFKKQWHNSENIKIILNTERKNYSYSGLNIFCPCVCSEMSEEEIENYAWSDRFKATLEYVDTKYCMFILDDFFMTKPVNEKAFEKMMKEVEKINGFACAYLCPMLSLYPNFKDDNNNILKRIYPYSKLKAQLVPAIWKTKELTKLIPENSNIWACELKMTDKSYLSRKKYYVQSEFKIEKEPVYQQQITEDKAFYYEFKMQLVKGKWSSLLVDFLEKQSDIKNIDFNQRGVFNWKEDNTKLEEVMKQRDLILAKGKTYYNFYHFLHNFLIPQLSRLKYKVIDPSKLVY